MFCALLTSRYQVSVYRPNGPLVYYSLENLLTGTLLKQKTKKFSYKLFASFL